MGVKFLKPDKMKKIFIHYVVTAFLFTLILIPRSYSQCVDFVKGGGGINVDGFASGVVEDASGNIYACGVFADTAYFGNDTLTSDPSAGGGFFFNKYDASGNQVWSKSLGSLSAPFGLKSITMSGGYIYVTCQTSYFLLSPDTINSEQVILWKLDVNGNLVWRNNYLSTIFSYPCGIIPDGSGGIYLTGRFNGMLTVGSVTLTANNNKTWIARINSSGTTAWAKQAGTTAASLRNRGNDLVILSSGNIVISGYYSDSLKFDSNIFTESFTNVSGSGKLKPYIACFTSSGNNLWIKGFTTEGQNIHNGFDCGYGISKDNADNIYLTGTISDSTRIGTTLVNADSGRAFLAKFSSAGIAQWVKLFASNGLSWGISAQTDNQNIFIVGNFAGVGVFGSAIDTSVGTNVFVVKTDMNGNISTHTRVNADLSSYTYQSYYDNSGSITIAGGFTGFSASFPFAGSLNNTGPVSTDDFFLWRICLSNITSVNKIHPTDNTIFISPNPATSELRIENPELKIKEIKIYDVLGEKVYSEQQVTSGQKYVTVNVSKLPSRIYFVRVKTSEGINVAKFVKE